MHSSLVLTSQGVPLGLAAVKFWTRAKFKGTNALKRKGNPTRIPIEQKESVRWLEYLKQSTELLEDPARCVHVGDREGDIFELFCAAQDMKTRFLVRTCVDRLAAEGDTTISQVMERESVRGSAAHVPASQPASRRSARRNSVITTMKRLLASIFTSGHSGGRTTAASAPPVNGC
jgi:hypothetical protein